MRLIKKKKRDDKPSEPQTNDKSLGGDAPSISSLDALKKSDEAEFIKISKQINELTADTERLKTSMEANTELRQVYTEKFSHVDEQVGELRAMIVDREKDLNRLEIKAVKAADLVSEVQPETLMAQTKKTDSKVETLKAKLESYNELTQNILEELKEVRRSIKVFRGVEEVQKMVADYHKDLSSFEKIQAEIGSKSDRVEKFYLDFNKKFDEFDEFRKVFGEFKDKFVDYRTEYETIKRDVTGVLKKSDFDEFKKEMDELVTGVNTKLEEFNQAVQFVNKYKELIVPLQNNFEDIVKRLDGVDEKLHSHSNKLIELSNKDYGLNMADQVNSRISELETANKTLGLEVSRLNNKIGELEKDKRIITNLEVGFEDVREILSEQAKSIIKLNKIASMTQEMKNIAKRVVDYEGKQDMLTNKIDELDTVLDNVRVLGKNYGVLSNRLKFVKKGLTEKDIRDHQILSSIKTILYVLEEFKKRSQK
ncbi:hypothetical protein GOV05_02490 [Candidatus Woesearchaeota archaeon]|nr:hypothetical protein [Candidatus Woesearchaeota archaeon]